MKNFEEIVFNISDFKIELEKFNQLLNSKEELSESKDILPFFKENKILSSHVASFITEIKIPNLVSFEFDIVGDLRADLVIGNKDNGVYGFVEFEDAKKNSIFQKKQTKFNSEYSDRYEHGCSQLIDWFYKIEDSKRTEYLNERFESGLKNYHGILIIGRNKHLTPPELKRLEWRNNFLIINSKPIFCFTYDMVYSNLLEKLKMYLELTK